MVTFYKITRYHNHDVCSLVWVCVLSSGQFNHLGGFSHHQSIHYTVPIPQGSLMLPPLSATLTHKLWQLLQHPPFLKFCHFKITYNISKMEPYSMNLWLFTFSIQVVVLATVPSLYCQGIPWYKHLTLCFNHSREGHLGNCRFGLPQIKLLLKFVPGFLCEVFISLGKIPKSVTAELHISF